MYEGNGSSSCGLTRTADWIPPLAESCRKGWGSSGWQELSHLSAMFLPFCAYPPPPSSPFCPEIICISHISLTRGTRRLRQLRRQLAFLRNLATLGLQRGGFSLELIRRKGGVVGQLHIFGVGGGVNEGLAQPTSLVHLSVLYSCSPGLESPACSRAKPEANCPFPGVRLPRTAGL